MSRKTTYASVAQMVRGTTDDDAFADGFAERLRSRRILKELMVLRATRGLSQGDVASKMGCTQSRISKLESSTDFDLSLGDLARYASAIGFRVGVVLEPIAMTAVARVEELPCDPEDREPSISFQILEGGPGVEAGPPATVPGEGRPSSERKRSKPRRKVVLPGRGDDGL